MRNKQQEAHHMHEETIPAPLVHRAAPRKPDAPAYSGLALKVAVGGIMLVCLTMILLR